MFNKNMISFCLIIIFLLNPVKVFGQKFKHGSEPDGFRGIKWGTNISTLLDMEYLYTDQSYGGIKLYEKKGDVLEIGGAQIEKIFYGFWNGRLHNVLIVTFNYSNWAGLKEACFEKFGKPFQPNKYINTYIWRGIKTDILLEYDNIKKIANLRISSMEINKEQKKYDKEKAKNGANKGF